MDSLERASSNQKKHRRLPKLVAAQARTMLGLSAAVEPSRHGQTVPAANAPERVRQRKMGSRFSRKMWPQQAVADRRGHVQAPGYCKAFGKQAGCSSRKFLANEYHQKRH